MNSLIRLSSTAIILVAGVICVSLSIPLCGQEFVSIRIKPLFREAIESDPFLMDGNIGAYPIKEKEYLISVGVSPVGGTSPNDILNARTVAEVLAHRQLAQFLYGVRVRSQSILKEKVVTDKTMKKVRGKATVDTLKKVEKVIEDIVIQELSQTLPGTETVGTWLNPERNLSFVAIALKIETK